MASVNDFLTPGQGVLSLTPSPTGSFPAFASNWADKRSIEDFGISLVIYGVGATADGYHAGSIPTGAAWLEYSNAPDQSGQGYSVGPHNGADDSWIGTGTSQMISFQGTGAGPSVVAGATGSYQLKYGTQWLEQDIGAHWVRAHWGASGTSLTATGLSANVYFSGPKVSA